MSCFNKECKSNFFFLFFFLGGGRGEARVSEFVLLRIQIYNKKILGGGLVGVLVR